MYYVCIVEVSTQYLKCDLLAFSLSVSLSLICCSWTSVYKIKYLFVHIFLFKVKSIFQCFARQENKPDEMRKTK